jgi:hypothetical protein
MSTSEFNFFANIAIRISEFVGMMIGKTVRIILSKIWGVVRESSSTDTHSNLPWVRLVVGLIISVAVYNGIRNVGTVLYAGRGFPIPFLEYIPFVLFAFYAIKVSRKTNDKEATSPYGSSSPAVRDYERAETNQVNNTTTDNLRQESFSKKQHDVVSPKKTEMKNDYLEAVRFNARVSVIKDVIETQERASYIREKATDRDTYVPLTEEDEIIIASRVNERLQEEIAKLRNENVA